MRRRMAVASTALVMVLALGAGACGSDDSDDAGSNGDGGSGSDQTTTTTEATAAGDGAAHTRDEYVTLLGGGGDGFTEDEARCMAEAVVDTIGVDTLEQADAFAQIEDDPDATLTDVGVVLDDQQVSALGAAIGACVDLRAKFEEQMAADGMSAALAACLAQGLDETMLQRTVVLSMVGGDAALDADPQLGPAVDSAATACAAQGIS
jgi:hypothetical protein